MLLEINLKDSEGCDVDADDEILLTLPEVDASDFYVPERVVKGKLIFQLSRGLLFKITHIVKDSENRHSVGQIIKFKFKKWHWITVPF
jgi:hypothetical protein